METSKEILTELQEIAPELVRGGKSRLPFGVPNGYFSDFSDILMLRIRFEAEGFSEDSYKEISASAEIAGLSPLLAGIQKAGTYQVPGGFFENLKAVIPDSEKVSNKLVAIPPVTSQNSRAISMPVRFIRYAAAACIVGLIGIVTFNMAGRQTITDPIKGLTTVSDQDMANYLDADDVHWVPGLGQSAEVPATQTASAEFSLSDIRDLMSSVPDDELEQYSSSLPEEKRNVN